MNVIIGCLMAKFYDITHHGTHVIAGKIPPIIRETVAGLCLGICAVFVPQIMFSGEAEIHHLMTEYVEYLPWMLICFPVRMIFWLAIGAFAGSSIMSMGKRSEIE